MNLEQIVAISGRPGLYKIVNKNQSILIVEGIEDAKRFPVYAHHQIMALDDIGIYTYEDTVSLSDLFSAIFIQTKGDVTISHKLSKEQLYDWLRKLVPDFDEARVYHSDIKKVVQWYNILHNAGLVEVSEPEKNNTNE